MGWLLDEPTYFCFWGWSRVDQQFGEINLIAAKHIIQVCVGAVALLDL
jgi:hypothetical protein